MYKPMYGPRVNLNGLIITILIINQITRSLGSELNLRNYTFTSIGSTSTFTSSSSVSVLMSGFVKVRKCCQLNEFFNVSRGKCESWSMVPSNGTRWSTWIPGTYPQATLALWSAFYDSLEEDQVNQQTNTLKFDSRLIGMPHCSGSKGMPEPDPNVETVVVKWNSDEARFHFMPGSNVLAEKILTDEIVLFNYHNPEQYCVDHTDTELILQICRCSEEQPCIRKCCPPGQHLDLNWNDEEPHACVEDEDHMDDGSNWDLPLYSKPGVLVSKEERAKLRPRYLVGMPYCPTLVMTSGWSLTDVEHGVFIIHQNGSPQYFDTMKRTWNFLPTSTDLCFDRLDGHSTNETCPGEPEVMIFCVDTDQEEENTFYENYYNLYEIALGIAFVPLLVTTFVLCLLLERKNVHTWIRLAYLLSHCSFYSFHVLRIFGIVTPSVDSDNTYCTIVAILAHFTGLSITCWICVINFELWWTFKNGNKLGLKRFLWYTLFVLGFPLLIVGIAIGIQSLEPKFTCRNTSHLQRPIPPHYENYFNCSMSVTALPFYWIGPHLILLLANFIFFMAKTCHLGSFHGITPTTSTSSSNGSKNGQTITWQIFVQIFILTVVNLLDDVLQWYLRTSNSWYWLIVDIVYVLLHMSVLFIIFVGRKDVFRRLQIKYSIITSICCKVKGRKMSTESTASCTAATAVNATYLCRESFELQLPVFSSTVSTRTNNQYQY